MRSVQELNALVDTKQQNLERLNTEADRLNKSIEQAKTTLAQLQQEIKQVESVQSGSIEHARQSKAKQDALSIKQRRARLVEILNTEGDIGATALSERLNATRGTVYNDLIALSKSKTIQKNSQGWEVVS